MNFRIHSPRPPPNPSFPAAFVFAFWNEACFLRAFLAHNSKFETPCFYDQVRASGLTAELDLRMFKAVRSSLWIRARQLAVH